MGSMQWIVAPVNILLIHALLTGCVNMVFNPGMSADESLIKSLGGPTKVAQLLGYDKSGGVQRVHNWCKRGIPARVKVARPDLFMPRSGAAVPQPEPESVA